MTTTLNVSSSGRVEIPEEYLKRKGISPGSSVRVTEVGNGFYVSPNVEPSEDELSAVVATSGSMEAKQKAFEEELLEEIVAEYRKEKRHE